MDKNKIKEKIREIEYYGNGLHKINGVEVLVRNLKIRKSKVIADIIIRYLESGVEERYNNCEYPIDIFS